MISVMRIDDFRAAMEKLISDALQKVHPPVY
jgi:hypothetical protein